MSIMKGECNMNNTCAATMNTRTSVNYEKKATLRERIKKYFSENREVICAGLVSMNGGIYIPSRYSDR